MSKVRRTKSFSKWSDLPTELLDLILSRMSVISIHNFRAVCPSWRTAAKSYVSSSSYSQHHQVPLLMLPPEKEDDKNIRFFSLEDKKVFKRKNTPLEFFDSICLGTSHGWLVMLDKKMKPCLFNPFSLEKIPLPRLKIYPEILSVSKSGQNGYVVKHGGSPISVRHFESVPDLRNNFIPKAVVSSNPCYNNGNFFVLMVVLDKRSNSELAFCRSGDSRWMKLGEFEERFYWDVVCQTDRFFTINNYDEVEIWDVLDSFPVKRTTFELPSFDLYDFRPYLVELSGVLFVSVRHIWINDAETEVPTRGKDKYSTLYFLVYKLDLITEKLEKVETLDDQVWFLGGNQSLCLSIQDSSVCKPNSIYFTDDNWLHMSMHYTYIRQANLNRSGNEMCQIINKYYDIGVFNMDHTRSKSYYQCETLTEPPPCWIDPKPILFDP